MKKSEAFALLIGLSLYFSSIIVDKLSKSVNLWQWVQSAVWVSATKTDVGDTEPRDWLEA